MILRNSLQFAGLAAAFILTAAGVSAAVIHAGGGGLSGAELVHQLLLAGEGLFAVSVSLFLMLFFRNTPSPEVYFFILAVQAFSFGALRPVIDLLVSSGNSYMLPAMLTRAFYFGRFIAILSIFISGLFAAGLALQRRALMLGMTFFVSVVFAAVLPVDISVYSRLFLFSIGAGGSMFTGYAALSLLSVANFLIAALYQGNRSYYVVALGVFLVIAGDQLIFLSPGPWRAAAGFALAGAGAYLFGSRTHRIYLWL